MSQIPMAANQPIGIFDSGIGGLSVLRHIQTHLPNEQLLYFADSGFAPYGTKPEALILQRSLAITEFLIQRGAKAIVVACNTATAIAIKALRERYPTIPLIGVEPGLKPAAAQSKTKKVGVLATENTLSSIKFKLLREQLMATTGVTFLSQACIGLADQVEKGELDTLATAQLVQQYVTPLIKQGVDTLVLGCTHYPFVQSVIENVVACNTQQAISLIDTGAAVSRHLSHLLQEHGIQRNVYDKAPISIMAFTTGSEGLLTKTFSDLLQQQPGIEQVVADFLGSQ